jgi:hypothetical protein
MKTKLASALLVITSLFGLAAGAKAQAGAKDDTRREVVVKVPYEFVVSGRTLPAGTYTVSRLTDDGRSGLSIVSNEGRSSAVVLPEQFENHPAGNPKLLFTRLEGTYFLSSIVTSDGVYTLSLPRSSVQVTKSGHTDGTSASGN